MRKNTEVSWQSHPSEFAELSNEIKVLYLVTVIYVVAVVFVIFLQPWLKPCVPVLSGRFDNPAFDDAPCRFTRTVHLLYLTVHECSYARRIVTSVILGGVIGWERREADRPAGIRTMGLVSLGASLFTLTSIFAFISGPNDWDAARVSAAIPSGVGFLGAALIFKQSDKDEFGRASHTVHGLTTAASVWLSAAVGISCGGAMYFSASFSVAVMLLLLRFGPRTTYYNETEPAEPEPENIDLSDLMSSRRYSEATTASTRSVRKQSKKPELV